MNLQFSSSDVFFGTVLVAEDPFLVNALMAILVGSLMVQRKMEGRIVNINIIVIRF